MIKDKNGNTLHIGDHVEFDAHVYAKTSGDIIIVPVGVNMNSHVEVTQQRHFLTCDDFMDLFSNDCNLVRGERVETDVYQLTNIFPSSGKIEFCKIVGRHNRWTVKSTFIKKVQHNEMRVE